MSYKRGGVRGAFALFIVAAAAPLVGAGRDVQDALTARERAAAISRASVWASTNVETMDLRAGPQGKGAFAPMADVTCTYVDKKEPGNSPKFQCEVAPGDEVKVKYSEYNGLHNGEAYGVVAASRLLWALGFGADRWYPVSVTCHGCPADPAKGGKPTTNDTTFAVAAIERKFPGTMLETHPNEGWDWHELALVDPTAGGAPLAHIEALELLAALIQHTDNKPEQQKLVCPPDDPGHPCAQPFMYIHDLGLTFGRATFANRNETSGVNLDEWAKAGVWKDEKRCVAKLAQSLTGSLGDPTISEPGRKFLADLLVRLSDRQLRDLFEVARFPLRSGAPVDAWVAAFSAKRETIVRASCPS